MGFCTPEAIPTSAYISVSRGYMLIYEASPAEAAYAPG